MADQKEGFCISAHCLPRARSLPPPQILFASSFGQVAVRMPRPGGQQSPLASAASPCGHCTVAEEPRFLPLAPSTQPCLFKCQLRRFVPGPFACDVASPLCVSKGRGEQVMQALVPGGWLGHGGLLPALPPRSWRPWASCAPPSTVRLVLLFVSLAASSYVLQCCERVLWGS